MALKVRISPDGVIRSLPLDPEERFITSEDSNFADAALVDFWRWAYSDLVGNTERGVLAEFLVAKAVGADGDTRTAWDPFDLSVAGKRIEVKSASFVQSWHQSKLTRIQFSIRKALEWKTDTNTFGGVAERHSDVYVFCLLAERSKEALNPLDLAQWEFYVIPTAVVDADFGDQKSVSLKQIQARSARYRISELKRSVELAASD
jgi:hypothetical protein